MKRQYHLLAVIFLFAAFPFIKAFSNNLSVSNVSYNLGNGTVTFSLSWDNGWRNTGATPNNWDAAWIFVKYRTCDYITTDFFHGNLSTTINDHSFGGTFEPTKRDGTVGMDDATGVMLRNTADPVTGTFSGTITLKVTNLPTTGNWDVRVFGIEMVFVPQGPFFLGDGNPVTSQISQYSFSGVPGNYAPFFVNSETISPIYEYQTLFCSTCNVNPNFPKGYNSYYIMKYEISQGQYAAFLSTAGIQAQAVHFPNQHYNSVTPRYSILTEASALNRFGATRPDRACNYLAWTDFTAYLDWAALRPLTELEYEKACRGGNMSFPFERAWGGTNFGTAPTNSLSGPEDGTEVENTANVNINVNNISWTSGDGGSYGPLRCGIFVRSGNTTRLQSGTGFYGAADLSGNVAEYYVSIYSGVGGSGFSGTTGDGSLNAQGNSDVSGWPVQSTFSSPCNMSDVIRRGGDFSYGISDGHLSVSARNWDGQTYNICRDNYGGGRGGR